MFTLAVRTLSLPYTLLFSTPVIVAGPH